MSLETIVVAGCLVVVLVAGMAHLYLQALRDAHPLVLAAQLTVAPTRNMGELPVYKHLEVLYQQLPRLGLDVRMGYRVRHGTVFDCWQLAMGHPDAVVVVGETRVAWPELHRVVAHAMVVLGQHVSWGGCVHGVGLDLAQFPDFVAVWACLLSGVAIDVSGTGAVTVVGVGAHGDGITTTSLVDMLAPACLPYKHAHESRHDLAVAFRVDDASFSQQNLAAATATLLRGVPVEQELALSDTMLVVTSPDPTSLVWDTTKVLGAMVAGCSVVVSSPALVPAALAHRPNVVFLPDGVLRRWLETATAQLLPAGRVLAAVRGRLQARGNLVWPQSTPRLVYAALVLLALLLTSAECTRFRSVTGARLVVLRYLPRVALPLFSTFVYDYRPIKDGVYVLRGQPAQCLETKVVDAVVRHKRLSGDKLHGEVCIRGYAIAHQQTSVNANGWMPTGLYGKYAGDGCFYEHR